MDTYSHALLTKEKEALERLNRALDEDDGVMEASTDKDGADEEPAP